MAAAERERENKHIVIAGMVVEGDIDDPRDGQGFSSPHPRPGRRRFILARRLKLKLRRSFTVGSAGGKDLPLLRLRSGPTADHRLHLPHSEKNWWQGRGQWSLGVRKRDGGGEEPGGGR
ncbi:hypothetical protein E2562_005364 [Oryza meyeriana var. granulata]|uniref:Uncharacterized protein n=1 Tax=Oryza meyeriana var. granulata TaxID=110450 RepID=A0A6G1DFM1_9ORYZ|nr:hypothetical protein E2562_005364 [Oryza meyeriana var. granulata]